MQTGADISGLQAAYDYGLATGGNCPRGFKTQDGPKPNWASKFNIKEHLSPDYPARTFLNVKESDGTVRLAFNFLSPGEVLTLKAIKQYKKPHFDVDLNNPPSVDNFIKWINDNNIQILNVAGNSEKTHKGITAIAYRYLSSAFAKMGFVLKS